GFPYTVEEASTVFEDLGTGAQYNTFICTTATVYPGDGEYFDLGEQAVTDLQANLLDDFDWFQVGLATTSTSSECKVFGPNYSVSDEGPHNILQVEYSTSGTLTVSQGEANPASNTVFADAQDVVMLQINLAADDKEDITISSLTIRALGTGDDSLDISAVKLYNDTNGNGAVDENELQIGVNQTYDADNGTAIFDNLNEVITQNTSENWLVVYDFAGTASNNETFTCSVEGIDSITAIGASSQEQIIPTGTFPVNGATKTISPLPAGELTVTLGPAAPAAGSIYPNAQNVGMLQITISANEYENIIISSVTFNAQSNGDDSTDIVRVKLFNDTNSNGEIDSGEPQIGGTQTYNSDNGTVTFSNLNITINQNSSVTLVVRYDFAGTASTDESFNCSITAANNITATGETSESPIVPSGAFPVTGNVKIIIPLPLPTKSKNASGCSCSINDYSESKNSDIFGYFIPLLILFGTIITLRRHKKK
ncbi:MAG: hypothetical protein ABIH42_04195, partial [Planctomycetota bacterium]